jgi:F-type H+-transporting ATPase subunit b
LEINWSTFLLEIFNFLVLIWILKRFLYQPVLDIIARRRAAIEDQLAQTKQQQEEADSLKQKYEHRLADWGKERQQAMDKLAHELEENRLVQMEKLKLELAQQEEKTRVARSRQDIQLIREIEQRALQQGAQFASRLLAETTGQELESRLFDLLLKQLKALGTDQITALGNNWGESAAPVLVSSAYPLAHDKRQQLEKALSRITGLRDPVHYEQDARLLAGLNITMGAWVLQLNVRDELRGFIELAHVES